MIVNRIKIDQKNWEKKNSLNFFLLPSIEWDYRIEREDTKDLALKATPKEHSLFILDHSLVSWSH